MVTCWGVPLRFASKTGGTKTFDAGATEPNFATIYFGDRDWRGIATASDPVINGASGSAKDLRHARYRSCPKRSAGFPQGAMDCWRRFPGDGNSPAPLLAGGEEEKAERGYYFDGSDVA